MFRNLIHLINHANLTVVILSLHILLKLTHNDSIGTKLFSGQNLSQTWSLIFSILSSNTNDSSQPPNNKVNLHIESAHLLSSLLSNPTALISNSFNFYVEQNSFFDKLFDRILENNFECALIILDTLIKANLQSTTIRKILATREYFIDYIQRIFSREINTALNTDEFLNLICNIVNFGFQISTSTQNHQKVVSKLEDILLMLLEKVACNGDKEDAEGDQNTALAMEETVLLYVTSILAVVVDDDTIERVSLTKLKEALTKFKLCKCCGLELQYLRLCDIVKVKPCLPSASFFAVKTVDLVSTALNGINLKQVETALELAVSEDRSQLARQILEHRVNLLIRDYEEYKEFQINETHSRRSSSNFETEEVGLDVLERKLVKLRQSMDLELELHKSITEKRIEVLENKTAGMKFELAEAKETLALKTARLGKTEDELTTTESKIITLESNAKTLKLENSNLRKEVENLRAEKKSFEEKINSKEAEMEEKYKNHISALQSQLSKMKEQYTVMQNKLQLRSESENELKVAVEALKKRNQDLESELVKRKHQLVKTNNLSKSLSSKLIKLETELSERDHEQEELLNKLAEGVKGLQSKKLSKKLSTVQKENIKIEDESNRSRVMKQRPQSISSLKDNTTYLDDTFTHDPNPDNEYYNSSSSNTNLFRYQPSTHPNLESDSEGVVSELEHNVEITDADYDIEISQEELNMASLIKTRTSSGKSGKYYGQRSRQRSGSFGRERSAELQEGDALGASEEQRERERSLSRIAMGKAEMGGFDDDLFADDYK
ncbi:hypothetical protein HK098_003526 [Nowakowskiella sp. JEL0407]|nr:hypothetical protein HK098_003526 [Nowakowskiella sp. JEL0407]